IRCARRISDLNALRSFSELFALFKSARRFLCIGVRSLSSSVGPISTERSFAMTELRRRMLEELQLRNYSPNTIEVYLRCVANFAQHFRVSPDRLGTAAVTGLQAARIAVAHWFASCTPTPSTR